MIELLERGALQQVGIGEGDPFESYFSGNTIQICPVGALTSAAYRFRSRPFDLVSSPSVCEHCAGGCATRTDHRRGKVMRRLAADDPRGQRGVDLRQGPLRLPLRAAARPPHHPLVRNAETGELEPASWPEALEAAARGLAAARGRAGGADRRPAHRRGRLRVRQVRAGRARHQRRRLPGPRPQRRGGRLPGRAGRRARGRGPATARASPTPRWRRRRPCCWSASRPRRRRPASSCGCARRTASRGQRTFSLATHATRGLAKAGGTLLPAAPGTETEWLDALAGRVGLDAAGGPAAAEALRAEGAGDPRRRAAGGRTRRADRGACGWPPRPAPELVWIPRRAGERGAVEAGALPGLLPGGRPAHRPAGPRRGRPRLGPGRTARTGTAATPARSSRPPPTASWPRCSSAASRSPTCRTRRAARAALDEVGFLVSLELRPSRGHRARRRGAAGGRGRREGRHLPQLGGPGAAVRGRRSSPTR